VQPDDPADVPDGAASLAALAADPLALAIHDQTPEELGIEDALALAELIRKYGPQIASIVRGLFGMFKRTK
jgi:hypothetical protein